MTKTERKRLERTGAALAAKLRQVEDAERECEAVKLVGTYWKYRNCYSCPDKESDYWWLYVKVVKTDGRGHLTTFDFQTDKYGNVSTKQNDYQYVHLLKSGYIASSEAEFTGAWNKMICHLCKIKP